MEMIREFYVPLGHAKLRAYGLIDCESLLSHLRTGPLGTETFLTRHFRSILDALERGDLGNVAWIPGTENPADGLTKVSSELGPLLDLLKSGSYRPRALEQLRGLSFVERLFYNKNKTLASVFPPLPVQDTPVSGLHSFLLLLAAKEVWKNEWIFRFGEGC